MELKDNWFKRKQIYSINYRPLKQNSSLVVETIRYNPSVCTCGKHDCEPHYRVESRVINIAYAIHIGDSMAVLYDRYNTTKSTDKFNTHMGEEIGIHDEIPENKSVNGVYHAAEEMESKPGNQTNANVNVRGDSGMINDDEIDVTKESGGSEDDGGGEEYLDDTGNGDRIKFGVDDNGVHCSELECIDDMNDSKSVVKSCAESEFLYLSKINDTDEINGVDNFEKFSSGDVKFNVNNLELKFPENVPGNESS